MPRRSTLNLTKRLVDSLEPACGRDYVVWDKDVTGFGIRVKETGGKSFVIKYRTHNSRQRKVALGKYGALTVEQARRLARQRLGEVASGGDPALEAKRERQAKTIGELCDQYFADACTGNILHRGKAKKASTLEIDRGRIERHIKPLLRDVSIIEFSKSSAEEFMHQVRDGKTAADIKTKKHGRARVQGGAGTAKKSLSLLSAIYSYAIRKGLVDENPCRYVERPVDQKRERFLTPREFARLGESLRQKKLLNEEGKNLEAIELIALTGCRLGEVLKLRRSEVDPTGHCFRLGDTKTGAQMRPCGQPAMKLVTKTLASHESDWVFPSSRSDGSITGVRKVLLDVCADAGVDDVTPHVFRHSFATVAHELGYSELTIAGLLGHRLSSVTSRYAHHVDEALAIAADAVSRTIHDRLYNQQAFNRSSGRRKPKKTNSKS